MKLISKKFVKVTKNKIAQIFEYCRAEGKKIRRKSKANRGTGIFPKEKK